MKKIFLTLCFLSLTNAAWALKTDQKLLNEMLTTLDNEYLYATDKADMIADGLQALSDVDARFTASRGTSRFYIYIDRQLADVIVFPDDPNDIATWVKRLAKAIDNAGEKSEKIAQKDFEIPDLMMKRICANLDKFSRYYSEYEYVEEEHPHGFQTLFSDRMVHDVLYMRLRVFNKQTAMQVERSLKEHPQKEGVIIDLRGNGGGMLNEALKVADFFTDGQIITYTAGRNNANIHYYTSQSGSLYDGPLVILTDGQTASAAEVLAAGLQEQSRAQIVGTRSFGKGTIQNITQMSNGGKLVLTTEQFFTPSGRAIHEVGVLPDVCTEKGADGLCSQESHLTEDGDIDEAYKLIKNEY